VKAINYAAKPGINEILNKQKPHEKWLLILCGVKQTIHNCWPARDQLQQKKHHASFQALMTHPSIRLCWSSGQKHLLNLNSWLWYLSLVCWMSVSGRWTFPALHPIYGW